MALTKPSNWQAGFPRTHRTTGCILTAASSYTRRLSWQGNLPRRSLRHTVGSKSGDGTKDSAMLACSTDSSTSSRFVTPSMLSVQSQQRRLNEGSWLHAEGHSNTGKSTGISTWFMFGVEPNSRALLTLDESKDHYWPANVRNSSGVRRHGFEHGGPLYRPPGIPGYGCVNAPIPVT